MQDELAPLLEAVLSIARDVDLDGVLERVVRAARHMVGARYAALGVLDPTGTHVTMFLHEGIDPETAEHIGPLPTGRGVLGELIRHPEPLLLEDLAEHPSSVGFPPNHPPMMTFLGVPVVVAEEVYGNLYLTEKDGGFSEDDRRLVVALAAVAGAAIRNARDVEQLAARARVDRAVAEVATAVLGGASEAEGLDVAAGAAAELVELPPSAVRVTSVGPGTAGEVVRRDGMIRVRVAPEGSAIALDDTDAADIGDLTAFASRTWIALGYAGARDRAEELAVRLDRERIARDLHDTVIQRLFGAGLQLDGLGRRLEDTELSEGVERVIDELDAAIADLRATIAALHDPGPLPLVDRLRAVVAALEPVTVGLRPLQVDGDPARVPSHLTGDIVAVLREGITNATRHAGASQVRGHVRVEEDRVLVVVRDDGVGPTDSTTPAAERGRGMGLGNLHARASRHGGGCELVAGPDGEGAQLRWWVPLTAG